MHEEREAARFQERYYVSVVLFDAQGTLSACEVTGGTKQGIGLEVPCVYHFVAKQRLIKTLL